MPHSFLSGAYLSPPWLPTLHKRVAELATRSDGWDSYSARALDLDAVGVLGDLLGRFASVMQTEPTLSLTDDGGLLCEWASNESALEIRMEPREPPWLYYFEPLTLREWTVAASECLTLEKWIWQASAA